MRRLYFAKVVTGVVCTMLCGFSLIKLQEDDPAGILVDLAKPSAAIWPFEVAIVGDNGERGLRIAPNTGRGWRGEAGGEASYHFFIPEEGRYCIWAYCLWFDECANAVFAQIDQMDKAIVGNDPLYNQWHWVRGFDVHLAQGTHSIMLSNHSDHVSLQKLLLTSASAPAPEDCPNVFADVFYDGFDGCDQGNFQRWRVISGKWEALNPTELACLAENALIGKSEAEALILYENMTWSDYVLNVSVRAALTSGQKSSAGICFGVQSPQEYHLLKWAPITGERLVNMEVVHRTGQQFASLARFESPWNSDEWHSVEIVLRENIIAVSMDSYGPVEVPVDNEINGGIGFCLEGESAACFDDVHVRRAVEDMAR
jgi:hypothetical protein